MKDPQRCSGTTREQPARKALSLRRSIGRPTLAGEHLHLVPRTTSISSSRSALGRPDSITRRSNAERRANSMTPRCYIGAGQGTSQRKRTFRLSVIPIRGVATSLHAENNRHLSVLPPSRLGGSWSF
jgi:hypothetical protein